MPRKKVKRKNKQIFPKSQKSFLLFLRIVIVVIIIINTSLLITFFADSLLIKDQYGKAKQLYSVASFLNPLNEKASKGITIADVIKKERLFELQSSEQQPIKNIEDKSPVMQKAVAPAHVVTIPVLMYHYIRVNPVKEDMAGFYLSVTPQDFDIQMKYLVDHGYTSITLDDFLSALLQTKALPEKPILITFDDGYRDAYTDAFPILKKYGLKAVNFIPTTFVDTPRYLTWDMIKEMYTSGVFLFASHTMTHLSLTSVSNETALHELVESKKILEEKLGTSIQWFAYPYGHMDQRVAQLVKEAGYFGAFGTNEGLEQSSEYIYSLPRVRIGGGVSLDMFAGKLPWK